MLLSYLSPFQTGNYKDVFEALFIALLFKTNSLKPVIAKQLLFLAKQGN
jgi:hypothetical protein